MDSPKHNIGGIITSAVLPHKISCVRWFSEQFEQPQNFLTGSWDCTDNSVTLWSQFHNMDNDDDLPACPEVLAIKYFTGDIVGLEFIDDETIACATSEGSLSVLAIARDNISEKFVLPNLHKFTDSKAPCTGLSVHDGNVATIGEDACLNIVSAGSGKVLRSIKNENACSMCSLAFVQPDTVLVSSRFGNIDCYDIRDCLDEPVLSLATKSEDENDLTDTTCISYVPVLNQIVFAGLEDGSIMGWDLRKPEMWSTHFKPHNYSVNDIKFRKDNSKMMFSATEDGDVYQWLLDSEHSKEDYFDGLIRSHGVIIGNHNAFNSIDVSNTHMICGGDDAFIYVLEIIDD